MMFSLFIVPFFSFLFGVSCSIRHNPEFNLFYLKGEEVPKDGFFDPSNQKDLDNAFTNFVLNTHPAFKAEGSSYSLERMGQLVDFSLIDLKIFNSCALVNSIWLSKVMGDSDMKPLFEAFWQSIGVFDYSIYYEELQICRNESDQEQEERNKKSENVKKNKRNGRKKKTSVTPVTTKKIPSVMCPELELVRSTLECSICQLTMSICVEVLSPQQLKELIMNLPEILLDNPEILERMKDFSMFSDEESVDKLSSLLETNLLTEKMVKTLPITSLFKIIESRNFEIVSKEERLLHFHRRGFELEEPFASDRRTFRLFADSKTFSKDSVDSIITAKDSESALAHYIRGEQEVSLIFDEISQISFDHNIMSSLNHNERMNLAIRSMIRIFNEREKLIESFEDDIELCTLLKTPLNGFILGTESSGEASLWKIFLKDPFMIVNIPYDLTNNFKNAQECFDLWTSLTLKMSDNFRYGRWARNFVKLFGDQCESIEGTKEILTMNQAQMGRFDPDRFNWFLIPLDELIRIPPVNGEVKENFIWSNRIKREMRKVLHEIDFGNEEMIEALWSSHSAMLALISFTDVISPKQIKDLIRSEKGVALLKENPGIVQRLCSYSDFTLEDMNRLNLSLDDVAFSISTLPVQVAQEWLDQQEYLVNSRVRTLFRPQLLALSKAEHSWQLITFESFKTSFETSMNMQCIDILRISRYVDKLSVEEKMSMVSRWMIHMELQMAWIWIISRLPRFNSGPLNNAESLLFSTIETIESPVLIGKLAKELQNTNHPTRIIEDLSRLIEILQARYISTSKFAFIKKNDGNVEIIDSIYPQGSDIYSIIKNDNDFIIKLIQDGPGSERFKRVWRHRAKLLVLTDVDMKTLRPFEGMEEADQGLIPLDDALLQWFIVNRIKIERFKIIADLRRIQGLPVEAIPSDVPCSKWYEILINK